MSNWDAAIPTGLGQSAGFGLSGAYTVTLDVNPMIADVSITNPDVLISIPPGRNLDLNGASLLNQGLIELNPSASSLNALFTVSSNIAASGSGQIWMRTSSDNSQIVGAGILSNAASHTIRGVGQIHTAVVNDGLVQADISVSVSGNDLEIRGDVTNNGTLSSATNSLLELVGVTIDQTGGGTIFSEDAAAVAVTSQDAAIIGGTIDRAGTGELDILSGGVAAVTSVTNSGFIDVLPGGSIVVDGTGMINDGTIAVNQNASSLNALMTFVASGNLDGSGMLMMRTSADNSQFNTDPAVTVTQGANHTTTGVGQLNASLINNGVVSADVSVSVSGNILELQTENKVNNGDLTAEGGSILQIDAITIDQLGGGNIISNGGEVRLNTVTVEGGTYSAPGGGLLRSDSGTQMLSGVVLDGPMVLDPGTNVEVDSDGLVNNSTIQLNPNASTSNAVIEFTESATLGGSGELQMRTSADNSQLNTAENQTLTVVSTQLVRGVGQLNASLVNNGEIRADVSISVSGSDMDLITNDKVNNNLMVAAASSFLDITGITVDQSGGGMIVADEGSIRINDAVIEGGDMLGLGAGFVDNISGSISLLSGVTLDSPMQIRAGSTVRVDADGLTNNGVTEINSAASSSDGVLQFLADTTLDGAGEIQMRTSAGNSRIETDPGFTLTHEADHSIRGVGEINAAMINNGTIRADVVVSVSGNKLELQGGDKINTAVMSAEGGSSLEITGITLTQTGAGELQANDGELLFNGSATLRGGRIEATGTGSYDVNGATTFHDVVCNASGEIDAGDTLTITGDGLVNNGFMRVNPSQSSADSLLAFPSDGFLNTGTGAGVVELFAVGLNSQIDGPGVVTNGPSHTIAGIGTIDTEFVNGGIIAPGRDGVANLGTLNASGDVTFASFGSMTIEVGNGNQSDRFAIAGTANLAGTLDVVLDDGFVIGNQIDYTILTAGNVVGTFDTENLLVDGQLITRILYEPTQVRLVTRCIADTNLDGAVTPTDFTAWVNAFNNGDAVADQNLDGLITPTDFTAWIANFNMPCP
ncbi:MAG: hypothetical protein ED559_08440 [Phycisphaera sp.]|nr:MAG: hypothetical protein ED559_08440 [Phycisphaera sp.]